MTRAIVLYLCVLIAFVNCNLLRNAQDIGTKDVPIPREDIDDNDLKPAAPLGMEIDVIPLSSVDSAHEPIKCAKIGEFCTFHGECCTRTCLGYAKKCVSGSGLYPDYLDPPNTA